MRGGSDGATPWPKFGGSTWGSVYCRARELVLVVFLRDLYPFLQLLTRWPG